MNLQTRANPDMLPTLLERIALTNPALMEIIQSNQQEFLRVMNEV